VPVAASRDGFALSGLIGLPTLNRGLPRDQFLVVNGRPVRDKLLVGAVRGAYHDLLARDRHPVVALFLDGPPEEIDVNVHPAKTEIRFRDAGLVRGLIVGALRHALESAGQRASTTVGAAALAAFRREQPFGWQAAAVRQLAGMDERYGKALEARDFGSPPRDPACACRLYMDAELAQVDEVGTVEARRGRGHASAAVLAASAHAHAAGRSPVFLLTDASDWPQQLYRRLGFDEIGVVHEFLKIPLGRLQP
jgi:GNAT superfamily N-acetyltransferase